VVQSRKQKEMVCLDDAGCPFNLECYTNITWYEAQFPGGSGCLCPTWYGFTGPNCTITNQTPTALWWLITAIINIILACICLFFALRTSHLLLRHHLLTWNDVSSSSALQLTIAFFLMIAHQIITAIEVENPSLAVFLPSPTADKIPTTQTAREIILIGAICCTVIAGLTLALVWVDLAERARKMIHRRVGSTIPITRTVVVLFEFVVIALMVVLCILDVTSIAIVVTIIVIIVCLVFYVVGFWKIYKEIQAISSVAAETNKKYYSAVVYEIARTALMVIVCEVALLILAVVIVLDDGIGNWKVTSTPNEIPPAVIAWQLLPLAIYGLDGALLIGLSNATKRRIASKTSDFSAKLHDEKGSTGNKDDGGSQVMWNKTEMESTMSPIKSSAMKSHVPVESVAAYQTDINNNDV